MTCYQDKCPEKATHIVYWPGTDPPPKYCGEHARKALSILSFLGTPTRSEEIKEKDNDK